MTQEELTGLARAVLRKAVHKPGFFSINEKHSPTGVFPWGDRGHSPASICGSAPEQLPVPQN